MILRQKSPDRMNRQTYITQRYSLMGNVFSLGLFKDEEDNYLKFDNDSQKYQNTEMLILTIKSMN